MTTEHGKKKTADSSQDTKPLSHNADEIIAHFNLKPLLQCADEVDELNTNACFIGSKEILLLYDALTQLNKQNIKDEFETTEQFSNRISTIEQLPLAHGVGFNDIFHIRIGPASLSKNSLTYNADQGRMQFSLALEHSYSDLAQSLSAEDFPARTRSYQNGKVPKMKLIDKVQGYLNQNMIMNRSTISLVSRSTSEDIDSINFIIEINGILVPSSYKTTVQFDVNEAKKIKSGCMAITTVKFASLSKWSYQQDWTREVKIPIHLIDICFFHPETGKVYGSTLPEKLWSERKFHFHLKLHADDGVHYESDPDYYEGMYDPYDSLEDTWYPDGYQSLDQWLDSLPD